MIVTKDSLLNSKDEKRKMPVGSVHVFLLGLELFCVTMTETDDSIQEVFSLMSYLNNTF